MPSRTSFSGDKWNTAQWTLAHVLSHFNRITVHSASPPVFKHYDPSLELSSVCPRPFNTSTVNTSYAHALLTSTHTDRDQHDDVPSTGYYINDELRLLAPHLAADIRPTSPFVAPSASSSTFVKLWVGGPQVVANLHYDATHNFFHQIHSPKTFILFPPDAFDSLYVHSRLHPSHRQSQLDLTLPEADLLARFPRYRHALPSRVQVTLQPGETMYLPPFWFHCVITTAPSISVNVWSDSMELSLLESLLQNAMPYLSSFEAHGWVHDLPSHLFALQLYVTTLLGRVMPRPRDWIAMHIDSITSSQGGAGAATAWPLDPFDCGAPSPSRRTLQRIHDAMKSHVDKVMATSFDRMPTNASKVILMSSFVEAVLAHTVDPVHVPAFLHACIATPDERDVFETITTNH
ncbi:hypothetical protein DYB25_008428 [Aphanomyces astaci]|uniref:JmjC domain-containing protein n=1 Tax=Aphanomyces astaci TaxID=112090 RepID=A0A397BNM4_APHAT|nr:hypothetical protein DYB25_008428 [Aphanomyces astaci]